MVLHAGKGLLNHVTDGLDSYYECFSRPERDQDSMLYLLKYETTPDSSLLQVSVFQENTYRSCRRCLTLCVIVRCPHFLGELGKKSGLVFE
jgi:hypothetical protein